MWQRHNDRLPCSVTFAISTQNNPRNARGQADFTWYCVIMRFQCVDWVVCSDVTTKHVTILCAYLRIGQLTTHQMLSLFPYHKSFFYVERISRNLLKARRKGTGNHIPCTLSQDLDKRAGGNNSKSQASLRCAINQRPVS